MQVSDVVIHARDGYPLAGSTYIPARGDLGVVVLVCPALAVPRRIYTDFVLHLVACGYLCVTFDYRGTGDSIQTSIRDSDAVMRQWGEEDIAGIIDWISRTYPRHRVQAVAHSAGGQMFGLAHNNYLVDALLCVGSGSGYWGLWPWPQKLKLLIFWYLAIPLLTPVLGYFPGHWFGIAPLPAGVAAQWGRWGRNPDYISDAAGRPERRYFHSFRGRLRLYLIGDDTGFAPPRAVYALAGFYANADRSVVSINPSDYGAAHIGHFGFFRDTMDKSAWDQCIEWLDTE